MTELVLRPMPSRPRRRPGGFAMLVGLLIAVGLFQWFCGLYVSPPAEGRAGQTLVIWRTDAEPFFNSPATAAGRGGPAGRVLVRGLPYWAWAYRASLHHGSTADAAAAADSGAEATLGEASKTPRPAAGRPPDSAERERRLERIRRQIERIREEVRREAAGRPGVPGAFR